MKPGLYSFSVISGIFQPYNHPNRCGRGTGLEISAVKSILEILIPATGLGRHLLKLFVFPIS